jgi:hypothetical protein
VRHFDFPILKSPFTGLAEKDGVWSVILEVAAREKM